MEKLWKVNFFCFYLEYGQSNSLSDLLDGE